jgi:hypothetical protein
MNFQRKKPATKLFSGLAGSSYLRPTPKKRKQTLVLLHFCFDQESGQTKTEHCVCETRAIRKPYAEALGFVEAGLSDWLIVRNARAKTGTSISRKSVVVRSQIGPDGKRHFRVPMTWQRSPSGAAILRLEKHEAIKSTILETGRNYFRKWFSRGWISPEVLAYEKTLDELLSKKERAEAFLCDHVQPQIQKDFQALLTRWWNNVLGYYHLDTAVEMYMQDAGAGRGLITFVGGSSHTELVDAMHETDSGKARAHGTDPLRYESEPDSDDPGRYSNPDSTLDDVDG